jgi:hypothetical protein
MAIIKEWSSPVNVAGEQLFKPGNIDKLMDGPHEIIILESWQEEAKGKNEDGSAKADNIVFSLEVTKGADKGKKARRYLAVPANLEPGSIQRKEWKNLLSSIVKDPAALEKGPATIKASTFQGKTAYIFVQNPADGATYEKGGKQVKSTYANVNFITKDMVAELAAKPTAPKAAAGANGAAPAKTFEVDAGAGAPQPGAEADALE